MKHIITYFSRRHLFANLTFIAVFFGGIFFWQKTGKEELPDMTLEFVTITTVYPGASAKEVEKAVTWPMEDEIRAISGIAAIRSNSSEGVSTITVEMEAGLDDRSTFISELRSVAMGVRLPSEILDLPRIREYKTSRKAIIDIGIYLKDSEFLDDDSRRLLQEQMLVIKNRLISLPEISNVSWTGYMPPEFRLEFQPDRLNSYRISVSSLVDEIKKASVRSPSGLLKSRDEARITFDGELNSIPEFESLPVQGSFTGEPVLLSKLARVKDTFQDYTSYMKINGREGIMLRVTKTSSAGILTAVDSVKKEIDSYIYDVGPDSRIGVAVLDDESADVRNRIGLITSNGFIGFILILTFLFLFMNFQSGFWVAMGIPFTFASTMIIASLFGFTINSITLAAVIIVMGMVVDDAIVVAENVMRLRSKGYSPVEAAIEGTTYVLMPITASILTTIAAFSPLMFFEGRLSMLTGSIMPIVSIMLIASLFESIFLLPAHLNMEAGRTWRLIFSFGTLPYIEKYIGKRRLLKLESDTEHSEVSTHWFFKIEKKYGEWLNSALRYRYIFLLLTLFTIFSAIYLLTSYMKFSLFPREEATQIRVTAKLPENTRARQTAIKAGEIERIFEKYRGSEVIGFRTSVRQSSHGQTAPENIVSIRVELPSADKRDRSLNTLQKEWQTQLDTLEGFEEIRFSRQHYGSSSGSPIEIVVQQSDYNKLRQVTDLLKKRLMSMQDVTHVEIDEPMRTPEYRIHPKRDLIKRLRISATNISQTLRASLEGYVLYELPYGEETKKVRLTLPLRNKEDLKNILHVPVTNDEGYLVPLNDVIFLTKENNPVSINRLNLQRMLMVYADLKPGSNLTPLDIAANLETNMYPEITRAFPGTYFSYEGEIKMTRESSHFFLIAISLTLFSIYLILALQFNSIFRPMMIIAAIPPAISAVVIIFVVHGMWNYGFFGLIGVMGLSGVIVNDAIVLLNVLEDQYEGFRTRKDSDNSIAHITSSRLRAVLLTTLTTVAGLFPTAYGLGGYDSMLAEMMLAISWGLIFGTIIILVLIPSLYSIEKEWLYRFELWREGKSR